jgi:hypothetical protein
MAERATIFQTIQAGLESTPGTGVAANKKFGGISIEPAVKANVKTFRAMGSKFPSMAAVGKEWVEAKIAGMAGYGEIIYPLASVLNKPTPTRNIPSTGLSYTWVFSPAYNDADVVATYTVEQGSSVRAHKFSNGLVTALGLAATRDDVTLSGNMIGKALQDAITMTAAPTAIELVPILGNQVTLYLADTAAGLTGASALARPLTYNWDVSDRFGPLWALNASQTSFATTVEKEPKVGAKMKMEADAEGMGLLTTLRAGATKFLRAKWEGATIETTYKYMLQIDMAVKVTGISDFSDEDGVFALEWSLTNAYDATWGKALEVTVVNQVAAL